ncbi:MAG: sigma-70 family RNA polymerase sigma factor [Phycisphaerales bacterium]|nr:sigma-70 family RNA polymerase sigma factor [Phycisphaerales bacterium]
MNQESGIDLAHLLERHRSQLLAFIRAHAGAPLLRFEAVEDLAQGVHTEALRSVERLEWRDEGPFVGWLLTIARRHLGARRDHWFALKRGGANLVRLTASGQLPLGARAATGPGTFAGRREALILVTQALELLPPRDRDLVRWTADDVPLQEQAERLGIGYDAVERARARALDRLRKAYSIVSRTRTPVEAPQRPEAEGRDGDPGSGGD